MDTPRLHIDNSRLAAVGVGILFFVVAFGIYANSLTAPFYFDDEDAILGNPRIRISELTVSALIDAAFDNTASKGRPLAKLSFALDHYVHGLSPEGFRMVNVLIHAAAAVALFLFVQTTLRLPVLGYTASQAMWPAVGTALLWLVHPVNTQSVTYIVQRMNSAAALFFLLSMWLFARGRLAAGRRTACLFFAGAVLAWLVALGWKQNSAILPFLILLYEWFFFQDMSRRWLEKNAWIAVAVGVLFSITAVAMIGFDPAHRLTAIRDFAHGEFTYWQRVLTQPRVVIYYIGLFFWPHPSRLQLEYDFPLSHSLLDPPTTLLSLLVVAALVGAACAVSRKERFIAFCVLWFFGTLAIESSFIPLAIIFEHRTYLPYTLLSGLVVFSLFRWSRPRAAAGILMAAAVAAGALWTYQRNAVWADPIRFWQDLSEKTPKKARPMVNLGNALASAGRYSDAQASYANALKLAPGMAEAHANMAATFAAQGETDKAEFHYREALRIRPDYVKARVDLGRLLASTGNTSRAAEEYRSALNAAPESPEALNNLGNVLARAGRYDEAITRYREALKHYPDFAEAHINLASALLAKGDPVSAMVHIDRAVAIDPQNGMGHLAKGRALLAADRPGEAVAPLEEAARLMPDSPVPRMVLAVALLQSGRIEDGIRQLEAVVDRWPEHLDARYNLGIALAQTGNRRQAIHQFEAILERQPGHTDARRILDQLR